MKGQRPQLLPWSSGRAPGGQLSPGCSLKARGASWPPRRHRWRPGHRATEPGKQTQHYTRGHSLPGAPGTPALGTSSSGLSNISLKHAIPAAIPNVPPQGTQALVHLCWFIHSKGISGGPGSEEGKPTHLARRPHLAGGQGLAQLHSRHRAGEGVWGWCQSWGAGKGMVSGQGLPQGGNWAQGPPCKQHALRVLSTSGALPSPGCYSERVYCHRALRC